MDENLDGVITQAESDKIKTKWAKDSLADPGKANVRIYNELVALGTDVGLDSKLPLGFEEAYAKSLEEDDESSSSQSKSPATTTTTSTSSIDPATLALLKSLGIDTSTLPASTSSASTSTAGSDANFGFSAAVLATLHPPKNVLDGLPIA
jgi:hypothetical protein